MRLIVVVVALFCAYLTGNRMAHPFIDGDLFWQRRLGEYVLAHHAIPTALGNDVFSAPGAPWVAHEWLLGIVVALAFSAHAVWVLSVLAGLAVFGALMLMALRAKRAGASLYAALAAMLFAGICLEGPFAIRAQVLAWPLLAALLLALDTEGVTAFWAVPIVIAWANLHASVMLAIPIVWLDATLFIGKRAMDARRSSDALLRATRKKKRDAMPEAPRESFLRDRAVRIRLALCVAVALAVLCTPLGVRLPIYAFDLMRSPIRQYIAEWQPLTGLSTQVVAGLLPLVAIVAYGAPKLLRTRPRDVVLTFLMAVWAILSIRNIALFAIVAAVPASLAVAAGEGWEDPLAPSSKRALRAWLRTAIVWIAAIVLVPLGWFAYHGNPITQQWIVPRKSIAALAAQPGEHRLFCAEFSWCALALGEPNVRVFLDGRADPFPLPVWQGFVTVDEMLPGWRAVLDRYGVNAVLVAKDNRLAAALRASSDWRADAPADPCCALFVKKVR